MRTPLLSLSLLPLLPTTTQALYPNPYGNPTGSILLSTSPNCHQPAFSNPWILALNSNNGSYADWATYSDTECQKQKMRIPFNNDDVCESFDEVQAVAFICGGFDAKGGDGGAGSSMPVITATYSDIPISALTKPYPSNSLATTTAEMVTSTSAPVIESASSPSMSSSTGTPRNGTKTSATLSAPSTLPTGSASSLPSCSRFVVLLIPACLLFTGL